MTQPVVVVSEAADAAEGAAEGVSERLERHGADIARIEAETRAEISRVESELRAEIAELRSLPQDHAHPDLEQRIAEHEHELGELEQQVEDAADEQPVEVEAAPEPEPERPPERPHFLNRKVF